MNEQDLKHLAAHIQAARLELDQWRQDYYGKHVSRAQTELDHAAALIPDGLWPEGGNNAAV